MLSCGIQRRDLSVLVDPVSLAVLILDELVGREPEADLPLGAVDAVRAVANVTADVLLIVSACSRRWFRSAYNSVVAPDGAGGRGKRVGSAQDSYKSLVFQQT